MADITDISIHRAGKDQKALQGKEYQAVHCLKIPLHNNSALLPNAAVAEVIAFNEPDPISDAPSWLLGRMQWRDRQVPLVSLEAAAGSDVIEKTGPRIAVLNTLNSNPRVPYIAILMQGIPSLLVIKPETLNWDDGKTSEQSQSVSGYIEMDGDTTMIPNIDNLEERIEKLHV
ncbi:MAG: chemotaxis protein CheW [Thioalkalispiraceae bacterium]|jgi:chemosensory pili system protein ChpC